MNQSPSMTAPSGGAGGHDGRSATLWTVERETTTTSHQALDNRPAPLAAPVRWVVGALIGLGGLAGLARFANARIEAELVSRTERSMRAAGLDPSAYDIDFDFRDGTVGGSLPDGWSAARFRAEVTVDGAHDIVLASTQTSSSEDSNS